MSAALSKLAGGSGADARLALVASTVCYYIGKDIYPHPHPAFRTRLEAYRSRDAVAVDMEAEIILVVEEAPGLISGVVLAVHANRSSDNWLEEFGDALDRMLALGCNALSAFVYAGGSELDTAVHRSESATGRQIRTGLEHHHRGMAHHFRVSVSGRRT